MPWWFFALFVLGFNFAIWGTIGLVRLAETCATRLARRGRRTLAPRAASWAALPMRPGATSTRQIVRKISLTVDDVAVLIPAHNEAAVLGASLDSIMRLVPVANIHVVSDGSTDDTPEIARRTGVHVHETERNVGKAGALSEAIDRFGLIDRYQVVLLLDADTRIQPDYFTQALPLFGDPEVVAVAGCVQTARDRQLGLIGNILVGYRERIYAIGQRILKFGQTYSRVNATHIVPGFASMYRSEVLARIDLNPPGLVIEDFNMTFEVYQKRLGKVAFTLSAVAVTQDPVRIRDYIKQTRRWSIGLWQTVRRHPPQANLFTAMLAVLLLEFITASVIFVIMPLIAVLLVIPDLAPSTLHWAPMADVHTAVAAHMNLTALLLGVGLTDYGLTLLVAFLDRRARLLFLGVFFPFVRVIDSVISLSALAVAWFARSNGTWKSPPRRAIETQPARLSAPAGGPAVKMPATRPESSASPGYGRERGRAS